MIPNDTKDYRGVAKGVGVIHDVKTIKRITIILSDKKIVLAYGHLRYERSLLYQQKCRTNNPDHTGKEGYHYHMMYVDNTTTDDLRIMPTHRVGKYLLDFPEDTLLKKPGVCFSGDTLPQPSTCFHPQVICGFFICVCL